MRRTATFCTCTALLFLTTHHPSLATAQAAQLPALPALVAALDARYNSMRSWQADFTQIYAAGLVTHTESGHLYLQKPGRMRWDYREPVVKEFLVSGKNVWQYTAGDSEATLTEMKNDTDLRTPLRYLLGHTDLNRELDGVSYSGLQPWHAGDYVIVGKPRASQAAAWEQVWIEITPTYEIDRLVIAGLDGSQNDIRLRQIEPNSPLPAHLFQFVPPPGVRVIPGAQ